jgi:hypothetical protein
MGIGYSNTIAVAEQAGTSRSAYTTAVSILPARAAVAITPDFWDVGRTLRLRAAGRVSNVVTSQPTFTFEFRLGPTANIVAWSSGAILTSTTAHTTVPWYLEVMMTVRALGTGTTANIMGQGYTFSRAWMDSGANADITTTGHPSLLVPETTPAVGTGWDSTINNLSDFYCGCSANAGGNLMQLEQYTLEALN